MCRESSEVVSLELSYDKGPCSLRRAAIELPRIFHFVQQHSILHPPYGNQVVQGFE